MNEFLKKFLQEFTTPQGIDSILAWAAFGIRLVAKATEWKGGEKLALELNDTADKVDAFRKDPVFKQEIDEKRLSKFWDAEGNQLPEPPAT